MFFFFSHLWVIRLKFYIHCAVAIRWSHKVNVRHEKDESLQTGHSSWQKRKRKNASLPSEFHSSCSSFTHLKLCPKSHSVKEMYLFPSSTHSQTHFDSSLYYCNVNPWPPKKKWIRHYFRAQSALKLLFILFPSVPKNGPIVKESGLCVFFFFSREMYCRTILYQGMKLSVRLIDTSPH